MTTAEQALATKFLLSNPHAGVAGFVNFPDGRKLVYGRCRMGFKHRFAKFDYDSVVMTRGGHCTQQVALFH